METVLIIETDTDTIDALTGILGGSGYLADPVDDIEAARRKVMASTPRLIVIGPQLGKSSGFFACSLIKKIPQAKNVPCVLLYTDREEGQVERHKALAGRAEVYLRKPFEANQFWAAVSGHLDHVPRAPDEAEIVVEEDFSATEMTESMAPPEMVEEVIEEIRLPSPDVAGELAGEVQALKAEVARLKRELEDAEKEAAEASQALAGAKGKGVSETRQILELKQQINKRDSELVDLREASLQKDKVILELKAKINEAEMKELELSDGISERDREIAGIRGQLDATIADKDVITRRADDLERRLKTTQDELHEAKERADRERAAHEAESRRKDEAHAAELQRRCEELTAAKDAERERALDAARSEAAADKDKALADQKAAADEEARRAQERHDNEIYEMQERFRRSMNQQEEKLLADKAHALKEQQEHHDGQIASLVAEHDSEVEGLKARIADLERVVDEARRLAEQQVSQIARLTEERDEVTTRRDLLDAELKASQMAAEQLRIDLGAANDRVRDLGAKLAETTAIRDSLRAKLEEDLARVEKAKQAVAIATDLLNDIEPI